MIFLRIETRWSFTILIVKLRVKVMCILLVTVSIINPHDVRQSNSLYHIRCFANDKDVSALIYSSSASPAKFVVLRFDDRTLASKRLCHKQNNKRDKGCWIL